MKQCFLGYMHDHLWRNLTLVFGLCQMGLIIGIVSDSEADDPVLSGICTCDHILFYACRIL